MWMGKSLFIEICKATSQVLLASWILGSGYAEFWPKVLWEYNQKYSKTYLLKAMLYSYLRRKKIFIYT